MKTIQSYLLGLILLPVILFGNIENIEEQVIPVATELRGRKPEWRPNIYEKYPNGVPKLVFFYEEDDRGEEVAVKRILFFENGRPTEETDLIEVAEDSLGFQFWGTKV